ncbi:MAG: type II secretion system F family protein [Phycisphaerae bacterium]|nr:type II secretion system F family protein [Phycisphaerae bacterium]
MPSVQQTISQGSTRSAGQGLMRGPAADAPLRGNIRTVGIDDVHHARGAEAIAREGGKELRLPLGVLVLATRQIAMMLRAGAGIVPALQAIRRQFRNPRHRALLQHLIVDMEEGTPLAEALRRYPSTFDSVYCAIVAAGEASGSLPAMFERLAAIVSKRRAMRKKVIGAFTYPVLLTVMCIKILLVMLLFVVPRFADMFVQLGVETPGTTKALLAVGSCVRGYWPVLVGALAALIGAIVWVLRAPKGKLWLANMQTEVPVIGRLRRLLIQAQVLRTMGTLIESKVSLLEVIELVRDSTTNRRFQRMFNAIDDAVTGGGRMSTAFEKSRLIEPYICQAVSTGEDTGNIGGALTYCADSLDESNTELIAVVTKLVEPLILVGMGLVVGFVAVSLFLPLFDLTSAIH